MDLEIEKAITKKKCLEQLIKEYNIEQAIAYIEKDLENDFTIKEKLLQAFPGSYGRYLCVHFGQFLNGKIDSEEKERANLSILNTINNIEKYLEENKETIEKYLEFINSAEYKKSSVYKMKQLLLNFQQENGYNDIFIENFKILSDSYREYYEKLQTANKVFREIL